MTTFLSHVDEIVLASETNPARFERYCVKAVSASEGGVAVLSTSTVWDRGRDGRGVGKGAGIYVCASLRDGVDAKAYEDIERLTQTTPHIKSLYFCSSQSLTEHRCDGIEAELREHLPASTSVFVLGAQQLAELGRLHPPLLEDIYGAEIRDIVERISSGPNQEEELSGLRLALLSTGPDESLEIRKGVYSNAILDALGDGTARTMQRLAITISDRLKLGRPIDAICLAPYVESLATKGFVALDDGQLVTITPAGHEYFESVVAEGASSLLAGRSAIRSAFEEAMGAAILDDEFQRIWRVFEDRLAYYLQSRGEQIVAEVSMLLGEEVDTTANGGGQNTDRLSFLDELADAVAATARFPDKQQVLSQTVRDLFTDRSGPAAKWLVSVCAAFVTACTLGLEHRSGQAVRSLMRQLRLVLDTDVALSLLGEGEPDHDAVRTVVEKWRENRGKVLIGTPVLQEVAYHASIAHRDYEQVKHDLPGSKDFRLRLIENAFVRSFAEMMSNSSAVTPRHWHSYISQFHGRDEYDYSKVYGYLQAEYGIERLPDRDSSRGGEVAEIQKFLLDLLEQQKLEVTRNDRDKAMRDAELYVSLIGFSAEIRSIDPAAGCILVSSAHRIAFVDNQFGYSGEARLVVSVATALYLVGTLPTVSLGLGALRSFLFDETRSRFSSDLERTALRMIHASKEHGAFVFSRRGMLMKEVRTRLVSRAVGFQGQSRNAVGEAERSALKPENRATFVETLAEALDAVASNSRTEARLKEVTQELKEAQRQLEIARARSMRPSKKKP